MLRGHDVDRPRPPPPRRDEAGWRKLETTWQAYAQRCAQNSALADYRQPIQARNLQDIVQYRDADDLAGKRKYRRALRLYALLDGQA